MSRQARRRPVRGLRSGAIACAAAFLLLVLARPAAAPEGHHHGPAPGAAALAVVSPRVVAASERYQLVGIVEGEVLVIYLDRADDNAPVAGATLEVSLNGEPFKAEWLEKTGTYEVTAPP